jgi:DNA-binding response OmpR family regulator
MTDAVLVPRSFVIGDLIFYAYDNRIFKDGADIGVSGKEYLILCCLAQRAKGEHKVVSREDILQYLYCGKTRSSRVLDVFLSHVRKRLRRVNSIVTIETVHSTGYCMLAPQANASSVVAA